ncbi:hypothetical protein SE17_38010, partial [Kouleothrix aurantiaca]
MAHVELGDGRRVFGLWSPGMLNETQPEPILGMLHLAPEQFGLAQVDVDGALLKAAQLAEGLLNPDGEPSRPRHPDVFDDTSTLPALRSGGITLFADMRAMKLLATFRDAKTFNDALAPGAAPARPFAAADLLRGYRLDVWDSFT